METNQFNLLALNINENILYHIQNLSDEVFINCISN